MGVQGGGKKLGLRTSAAGGVKREWDERKEIELLGVANFDISFKPLASLPFLLSKEEYSKNYLLWPAWSVAPFAIEERKTSSAGQKKQNPTAT